MSDNMNKLPDEFAASVSGGKGADGPSWVENGITYYRIVRGDTLSQIAQRFGTSVYQLQALNSGLIKNIDVIREGWVIRIY
ncbi:MAG: LysM peptidoglycan-binding domain-containing protein [Oscillospiraceae bacterium]|mgnify:CR=1 FL=1|nr:LysM peptidoglycan-binding domain-containing protein [Oscillospiraceae bacterium]